MALEVICIHASQACAGIRLARKYSTKALTHTAIAMPAMECRLCLSAIFVRELQSMEDELRLWQDPGLGFPVSR